MLWNRRLGVALESAAWGDFGWLGVTWGDLGWLWGDLRWLAVTFVYNIVMELVCTHFLWNRTEQTIWCGHKRNNKHKHWYVRIEHLVNSICWFPNPNRPQAFAQQSIIWKNVICFNKYIPRNRKIQDTPPIHALICQAKHNIPAQIERRLVVFGCMSEECMWIMYWMSFFVWQIWLYI